MPPKRQAAEKALASLAPAKLVLKMGPPPTAGAAEPSGAALVIDMTGDDRDSDASGGNDDDYQPGVKRVPGRGARVDGDDAAGTDDDGDGGVELEDEGDGDDTASEGEPSDEGDGAAATERPGASGAKRKRGPAAGRGRAGASSKPRGRGRGRGGTRGGKAGRVRGQLGAETVDDDDAVPDLDEAEAREGDSDEDGGRDYTSLQLRADAANRPLYVLPNGRIILETFSPVYKQAYDFLIAIAEPVCRPLSVHEYALTPHSLYAAVSVGLETSVILAVLARLSKTALPPTIERFVRQCTLNYGKVKLVLQHGRFFVESPYPDVLRRLLADDVIKRARVGAPNSAGGDGGGGDGFASTTAPAERAAEDLAAAATAAGAAPAAHAPSPADAPSRELHSFEVDPTMVQAVKQRCLPNALNYPMLEEYDFRNDTRNPDLPIELKPIASLRPYQEKSLAKMFGNGRARSGIIVLPCGAGKSLTGVAAAARIRKSVLVLCTSAVSVDQWKQQFLLWSTVPEHQVSRFTSADREMSAAPASVLVTTYNMIAFGGRRAEAAERILAQITDREWGLLLMDEVHVVPAEMFRKVISLTRSHCKLGLTATLVREDERIADLNFLIGPKLYEANWLDLQRDGHIANVQCAEVWCPMTKEFYREYLKDENAPRQQALYVLNPYKVMATQFLIEYHERQRGDKILVFSDNIFALRLYAKALGKPFIYGGTSHHERTLVLHNFKHNPAVNTVFISKVGDNSINIPEASVLIQISSHAGSRRQEAQRLGRILRPKAKKAGAPATDEHDAYFYSLVSTDTAEMYYSAKRQQFLIDQGYAFKVVTNLLAGVKEGELLFSTKKDQLDLLSKVLTSSSADVAATEEAAGDTAADLSTLSVARQIAGNLSALTGAQNLRYSEMSTGRRAGGGARPAGAAPAGNRSSLWSRVKKY